MPEAEAEALERTVLLTAVEVAAHLDTSTLEPTTLIYRIRLLWW